MYYLRASGIEIAYMLMMSARPTASPAIGFVTLPPTCPGDLAGKRVIMIPSPLRTSSVLWGPKSGGGVHGQCFGATTDKRLSPLF